MALSGSISMAERYQLAREAGFSPPDAIVMTAISMAECANCDMGTYNATGDSGLWQINKIHGWSVGYLSDPLNNARAAYSVWKGAGGGVKGFQQWCTYPGGCGGLPGVANFPALLTQAAAAATGVDPSAPGQVDATGSGGGGTLGSLAPGESVTSGAEVGADSGGGQITLFTVAGKALTFARGILWSGLLIACGVAAILAGMYLYFHEQINSAVGSAAEVAAVAA